MHWTRNIGTQFAINYIFGPQNTSQLIFIENLKVAKEGNKFVGVIGDWWI